ncbi:MAG TPA: 50S ribosomal protein L28 [Spirochaetia bacterium]|nr:50S ribosomal protein L28 [Spirochaetia bacterium]
MARECDICGKHTVTGNTVSHAHNKTRRVWKPNLVRVKTVIAGTTKTMRVCTRCLKAGKVVKAV